jgi:hypothetical protein
MLLNKLINKSIYGTIGYISSQNDLELLEQYILYNLSVLKKFKQVIVATNYKNYPEFVNKNIQLWKKYFPNCILLNSEINRGHNFGTADLDNMLFDWCKGNNEKWLCKSVNDIILQKSILDKEVEEADFYYLNGIGYGGMYQYNFDFNRIINEDFYPQTNFYFINVNKTDYLNNKEYLDITYGYTKNIPNYDGKIWEHIQGWSCEDFLKQCVGRNNLKKYHLIPQNKYFTLLETIKNFNTHDPSHKNIMIGGVCHFHYPNEKVIEI